MSASFSCATMCPCAAASVSIATTSSISSCAIDGSDTHDASPRSTMPTILM